MNCDSIPDERLRLYVEGVNEQFKAKVRIPHQGFNRGLGLGQSPHDIALFKLNNPVKPKKSGNVRQSHTICLPDRKFPVDTRDPIGFFCRAAGYAKANQVRDTTIKIGNALFYTDDFELDVQGLGKPQMKWFAVKFLSLDIP